MIDGYTIHELCFVDELWRYRVCDQSTGQTVGYARTKEGAIELARKHRRKTAYRKTYIRNHYQ